MATTLGAVAEGSIVYLNESGVAVPFYVAKHNYESALNGDGRTLLVRKDCYDTRAWHSSDVNAYASSSVDNWLNSTYKALLDANVQSAIGTTKFYYTPGNGNTSVTALTRGIFLLSLTELGKSTGNANTEGSALPIASTLQIAYRNESVVSQWTRSPLTNQTAATFALSTSGNILGVNCTAAHGSRPAFTLPSTMEIGENGSEYTWLEWIESDAASYIDTGFIPNSNTRVVADIETATSFSANKWVFGQRSNSNTQRYEVIYIASADEIRFYVNTSNYAFSGVKLGRLSIDVSAASATINGVTVTPSVSSFSGARTLYICDCNSSATSNEAIKQKVYSFQIYDNNTLVRDFIPARRNSDGAVGLLDQANNVFYGNAGTGTFTAGPEIASTGSLANIDNTSVLLTGCLANVGGIECAIPYALANVDGIEVVIPFDMGPDYSDVLDENTPEMIAQAAIDGVAPDLWDVGDTVGIALNGTVGALTFSNETYYAFILGFDHNPTIEGYGTIHFQMAKTAAGVDIAFVDSNYNSTNSSAGFRMNTNSTNSGGWNGSYMRGTICPAFLSAMPTEWQNVIAACTKYSDNTGGGSNTASYVTATSDNIWLLSEFEVRGARSAANSAEQNYQKQYDYYKNGNSKVKYKHNATTTACYWWHRSVRAANNASFCIVGEDGGARYLLAYYSFGFAPGFVVGNAA